MKKIILMSSLVVILVFSLANESYAASLLGTGNSDVLNGTPYDDTIALLAGDDIITFSTGHDFINGGSGFDTIDYSSSPFEVGVKMLKTGTITTSSSNALGPSDVLTNFELIIGSHLGDNFVGFSEGVFVTYRGGLGDDDFSNIDSQNIFVSYNDAENGVLVDLSKGNARSLNSNNDAGVGTDTFRFVNSLSVIGSEFDDKIIANNGDNTIEGKAGNDFLDARGGTNFIDGGDGIDYCNFDPRGNTVVTNCEVVNGIVEILDSDGDYVPDELDECPFDLNKVTPGINGCGVSDDCGFGTIQSGGECVEYHGGIVSANVIVVNEDTTANIEIKENNALVILDDVTFTGNIKIVSGELILNEGCTVFGNIESASSSITINSCMIAGNVFLEEGTLEVKNSTMKGNVSVKNAQNTTVMNSRIDKNLDMTHITNSSVTDNHVYETLRIMFGANVTVADNQVEHKLILYRNDDLSSMDNSAKHLVTKYNTP